MSQTTWETGMEEVWLKRCLACGGLNEPLATKCEHCEGSGFERREEDRPPGLAGPAPSILSLDQGGLDHGTLTRLEFCYPPALTGAEFSN